MLSAGLNTFIQNIKDIPKNLRTATIRHGAPTSDRTKAQTVFANFFLHLHPTRVHPHSLKFSTTLGLGVALISQFIILTFTGVLLMVYYTPATNLAYDSIKDIHFVVPAGRFMRNIHRWAAHLMVLTVLLHMARVFYTSAYKAPREMNWLIGMILFVLTLGFSFTGYLLPWDQLAYWAVTIGANIAASPNELVNALGLPPIFNVGDIQKQILLGASSVGQGALTRFYLLHVMILPIVCVIFIGVHMWRVRKDGGLARPGGNPTTAGQGVGAMKPAPATASGSPTKTYGLMAVVPGKSAHTGKSVDETVPSWPYLMRAELMVFMVSMFVCVFLAYFFDAPLKELANPTVPENPAKAPWYFLGLQEMVSYSAFIGGIVVPSIVVGGLAMIPFLDREKEDGGVWLGSPESRRIAKQAFAVGAFASIMSVAFPVNFGWLRNWFPTIPQLAIILINPGSLLTAAYAAYSIWVLDKTKSTRLSAVALFSSFIAGFVVLTYVGTFLRGPNWGFYWTHSSWPLH